MELLFIRHIEQLEFTHELEMDKTFKVLQVRNYDKNSTNYIKFIYFIPKKVPSG